VSLTISDRISDFDYIQISAMLRGWREPDMTISPGGKPYIYRWFVIPRRVVGANVYLHLQVADDTDRALHDHPWDNQSVILAGGYRETFQHVAHDRLLWEPAVRELRPGDVVHRRAEEAHRLELLPGIRYSISLFTTGPVIRDWGFWEKDGWRKAITDGEQGAMP
jgi:hypothetical protein